MSLEKDWAIERDGKEYDLKAELEVPQRPRPAGDDASMTVWHGRLDLPPVRIPRTPAPLDPRRVEQTIRDLGKRLLDKNCQISEEAARALSLIDDERVIPCYLKAMDTDSYHLKFVALDRLARFNSDEALRGLRKGMTTQGSDIGNCSNATVAAELANNIRTAAAQALARSPHPDARQLLLSMWDDPYAGVRLDVVHALGKMQSEESLSLLKKMSKDPDERVGGEALRYLKQRRADTP